MVKEYRSLYNFLSCDTHSNIRALISRHIDMKGSDFEVCYYKDEPIGSFAAILDTTSGLLLNASLRLHGVYQTGQSADVQRMLDELTRLRGGYAA